MRIYSGEIPIKKNDKIRATVISIFFIVSIISLASLFLADNFSIYTPIAYIVYIVVTLYFLIDTKTDILSPLFVFILFTWVSFGLKFILMIHDPSFAFFSRGYAYNFQYDINRLSFSFAIFLIGYFCFLLGFKLTKVYIVSGKGRESSIPEPITLAIAASLMIIISFIIRNALNIALPGVEPSGIYIGYISYFIRYLTFILLCFLLYSAFEKRSLLFAFIALFLFFCQGFAEILFAWRGPLYHSALLIVIIIFYVSRYRSFTFNKNFIYLTAFMVVLVIIFSLFVYPAVTEYRSSFIGTGGEVNITSLMNSFGKSETGYVSSIESLLKRFVGMDHLHSVIVYFDNGLYDSITNDFFLFNSRYRDISPVQFYTWYILGSSPEVVSANAPSSWGSLYIYGGLLFIILFFLALGFISKFIYNSLIANIEKNGRLIILYALFLVMIFRALLDGNDIVAALKSTIALIVTYYLVIKIFDVLGRRSIIQRH